MTRARRLSPWLTLAVLAVLSLLVTGPLPAEESIAAVSTPNEVCEVPESLDPAEERVLLAPPCDPGETQHQCDIQDNCTGRHFKDSVCCGAGTHGDCLVAVNGLGCVISVDAVCVPDP